MLKSDGVSACNKAVSMASSEIATMSFLQQMQLLFRIFQRQDKNEMDINVLILLRAAALSKLDGRDQTACGNLSVYHVIPGSEHAG